MIVVCANCISENTPGFIEEKPPYTNSSVSHGICARHREQYREQLRSRYAGAIACQTLRVLGDVAQERPEGER